MLSHALVRLHLSSLISPLSSVSACNRYLSAQPNIFYEYFSSSYVFFMSKYAARPNKIGEKSFSVYERAYFENEHSNTYIFRSKKFILCVWIERKGSSQFPAFN